MKIDLASGLVCFECGSIGPGTNRQSFLRSELGGNSEILVENEPHITYRIRPETGVTATVYFLNDQLRGLTWLYALSAGKEQGWNEELELERKRLHDDWLRKELGAPPYCYSWGEISSEYDPRGCVSDIILNYAS